MSGNDFSGLFDGATFMARFEHACAFEFLLQSGNKRLLSKISALEFTDEKEALRMVLERFRRKGLDVYVVDLSTDEALRSGVRVVRVLVPGLQPFSFQYRAQYKGHRRLYDAPKEMGYPVHDEDQLNTWPQPFA